MRGSYSAFFSLDHSVIHTCRCCRSVEASLVALAAQRVFSTCETKGQSATAQGFRPKSPKSQHARQCLLLNAPEPVINFIAGRLTPQRFKGINYPASLVTLEKLQCDSTKGMSRGVE